MEDEDESDELLPLLWLQEAEEVALPFPLLEEPCWEEGWEEKEEEVGLEETAAQRILQLPSASMSGKRRKQFTHVTKSLAQLQSNRVMDEEELDWDAEDVLEERDVRTEERALLLLELLCEELEDAMTQRQVAGLQTRP